MDPTATSGGKSLGEAVFPWTFCSLTLFFPGMNHRLGLKISAIIGVQAADVEQKDRAH